jgi:hypothetical protein
MWSLLLPNVPIQVVIFYLFSFRTKKKLNLSFIVDCKESQENQMRTSCCRCSTMLKLRDGESDIEQKAIIMVETWLRAMMQVPLVVASVASMPEPSSIGAPIKGA